MKKAILLLPIVLLSLVSFGQSASSKTSAGVKVNADTKVQPASKEDKVSANQKASAAQSAEVNAAADATEAKQLADSKKEALKSEAGAAASTLKNDTKAMADEVAQNEHGITVSTTAKSAGDIGTKGVEVREVANVNAQTHQNLKVDAAKNMAKSKVQAAQSISTGAVKSVSKSIKPNANIKTRTKLGVNL